MKNIIIGTAGHVDHGKTSLIKALTGEDTDRFEEEKRRGITIDIGFAYFTLPNGEKAGIIDVPGHEKFVKNMLAGVSGMDLVLLVIAADEGIMPQTKEHLDILSILKIKKGIIVLTKKDIVKEDWLEMVEEEIKEEMKDTFLKDAPIVKISSETGEGIEQLKEEIVALTESTETKNTEIPFRIPIDRVFSVDGFGTVVTGTQTEGQLKIGDEVELYPSGLKTKIRNIQVHGETAQKSYAGQRVAINLQNIKKDQVQRGDTLAEVESMEETHMLDVKLELLKSTKRELQNRTRVRLYYGTSEILCRVVLLDKDQLKARESCFAQLRLEEKVAIKKEDHFVLRFYSPMETIGGGIILDNNPAKHKRFKDEIIEDLKIKETGAFKDVLEVFIKKYSKELKTIDSIKKHTGKNDIEVQKNIEKLNDEGKIIILSKELVMHIDIMASIEEKLKKILRDYHRQNTLKSGIGKEELRKKLFNDKSKWADLFINYFIEKNVIKEVDKMIAMSDFKAKYTDKQLEVKAKIISTYKEKKYEVPYVLDLARTFENEQEALQIIQKLVDEEILIKIDAKIYIHKINYDKSLELLKEFIKNNGSITIGDFRDLLNTSRKYALPILEYFDEQKITKMIDEARILIA